MLFKTIRHNNNSIGDKMHENVWDACKCSLLGKSEIVVRKFPKVELPLGHIFHGFYSLILK